MCDTHAASHEARGGAVCAPHNNTRNTDTKAHGATHTASAFPQGTMHNTPAFPHDATHTAPAVSYIDNTHATRAHTRSWSTQQIALCALLSSLSALSTLMLEFPIMPGISWLKYDPSVVVALLGGALFGPGMAVVLSIVPYLVHIGTATGVFGAFMASISCLGFAVPVSLIYRRFPQRIGLVIGLLISALICLIVCLGANLIITPLYTKAPFEAVLAMIVPLLLPFNVIKLVLNSIIFLAVLGPAIRITRTLFPR